MNHIKLIILSLFFPLAFSSCQPTPAIPTETLQPKPTVTSIANAESSPCTSFASIPTLEATEEPSLFPPITSADHILGPENATVTIMVYGDLQYPASSAFAAVINQLLEQHPGKIQYISRIFPFIGRNDKAVIAAQAVEAANLQGRFWELHDLLYTQQENWINLPVADFEQWVAVQASVLGMDVEKFQADVKSDAVVNLVQKNYEDGVKFGPFAVPLIVINEDIYLGPQDFSSLNDIVGLLLLGEKQFTCPILTVDETKQYIATLHTEKGDVVIQLFADKAPYTVNSFIFLAEQGWYDNITFHRVIPELYAQSGDPSGSGKGTPGYYVVTEISPDLTFDKPGMVAMVNSGPDASGSQFFITLVEAPQFDGQYTIFGEVLSGMDVLSQLTPRNAQVGTETPPGDKLLSVTVEEK